MNRGVDTPGPAPTTARGTRQRALALATAIAAGAALGAAATWLVREEPVQASARGAGLQLAAGIARAMITAEDLRAPHRCARLELPARPFGPPRPGHDLELLEPAPPELVGSVRGRAVERTGAEVTLAPADRGDRGLVLGVVADARGAQSGTLAHIRAARESFSKAGVEVVLSLGGMGASGRELEEVYGALATDAPWLVVAIPGDRAPLPVHQRVVARLAERAPIVDGASVRLVTVDGITVGTFPGVAEASQLVAGTSGCRHTAADADALAAVLADRGGTTVWAGYAPPRQDGPGATDLAAGGIHVGERLLAGPVAAAGAELVLHGLVDEAALGSREGDRPLQKSERAVVLGAGPLEAMPVLAPSGRSAGGSALVVRVAPRRVLWWRIRFDLPRSR